MSNTKNKKDELDKLRADIESQLADIEEDSAESEEKKEVDETEEIDETEEVDETEESDESEEDTESDNDAQENKSKPKKRMRLRKKWLLVPGAIICALIGAYIGLVFLFETHYMFNTTINGKDYSLKSAQTVAQDMEQQVQGYALTLNESDGDSEVINGKDISLEYVPTDELEQLAKSQNNILWITSLWEKTEFETKVTVQYDDAKLTEIIAGLACMNPENQVASVSAKPEFKETQFEITEEVIGTEIDTAIFNEAVRNSIEGFQDTMNLSETQCYLMPAYVSTSEEVIKACEEMNSYLGAEITYDMHPDTVVVDSSVISQWVTVNKKMEVKFSEKKMKEYLSEFGKKYDTWGKERTFKAANGNTVKVSGGRYGWLVNEKEEFKQLKKDIEKGEKITREPVYYDYGKAVEHTATDWGDTYAEVDLTNQKMYFVKDGNVVLESPIVTGNPNRGNATPQGVYSLTYKTRNAVLRGERDENGEPEYETPVAYWMPFNYGIGFHDATWQSSFGGSRYKTHGSHGCVNMPKDKAAKLYELIPEKCPVICHY